MKKTSVIVTLIVLLTAGFNTYLWAESPSDSDRPVNRPNQSSMMPDSVDILPVNYLDKEVITSNGESVGKIDRLVINNTDHAAYAILSVGGFLGMGDKEVAIPVNQLRVQGNKWELPSTVTKKSLMQEKMYEESEFSAFEMKDESYDDYSD